ncbi:Imidazoleglycerol-phosphate dehydratase [Neofusicoccum parvum]|uniref:Imidazoleglycerol-phosphate dehydratase n=1 Tax=Neofusicoccum parvum TaxID=310453 RepID=A0ACB5SIV0_9PEZI|nr:Imidazoleglycerol-phosphate dehydratase [Neofusicoccum parvum]
MRALRSYGAGDIRVVDVDEPTPSDDKVIVEVEWCGICGSDLHLWHMGPQNMLKLDPSHTAAHPLIMGHEIAGRVVDPGGSRLARGAPVVLDPRLTCAACPQCTAPDPADGEPRSHGCARGISFVGFDPAVQGAGFAERLAVAPKACRALPGDSVLGLECAALVEPLAVAWHAVKRAGVGRPPWVEGTVRGKGAGETAVLVVGGGPVGVAICHVLRAWGVGKVVVSEPLESRRKGCRGLVDEVVDPVRESVVERCKELTGGSGVDVVFECSGSPRVVEDVFGSLGWRGTVVVVSLWKGDIPVPFPPLMYRETNVTASCAYNEKDFEEVVKAFSEGRFKGVESMITARISLEDVVEKGFGALDDPNNSHVKILITPKKANLV